jgi:hypothetical protein
MRPLLTLWLLTLEAQITTVNARSQFLTATKMPSCNLDLVKIEA